MTRFTNDNSLVRGVVETYRDQLDNYDDFVEAINEGNIEGNFYDTYYHQTGLVKDKAIQYELRVARLKQLIMNFTLDIKYMQIEMWEYLTDNREYFHGKGVFNDLMAICNRIGERRYEYDIDKTVAKVNELLAGDHSKESRELVSLVDKRVSRNLVQIYSRDLFELVYKHDKG